MNLSGRSIKSTEKKTGFFFFWERKGEERLEKEGKEFRLCSGQLFQEGRPRAFGACIKGIA